MNNRNMPSLTWIVASLFLFWSSIASADEQVLAREAREGLSIVVVSEAAEGVHPPDLTLPANQATHHIEVLATFTEGNPYGGRPGDFFPYLRLFVATRQAGGEEVLRARLIPLAHHHGLHYGANVKLLEKGRYEMTLRVEPPGEQEMGRHDDVQGWFEPFEMVFELVINPTLLGPLQEKGGEK